MVIAVDFDGTCVTERFPLIGLEIPYCVETLKKLQENGHKIILWTVRGMYGTSQTTEHPQLDAVKWFEDRGIKLDGINFNPFQFANDSRKIYYDILIDDRAFGTPMCSASIYDPDSNKWYKEWRCVDWKKIKEVFEHEALI